MVFTGQLRRELAAGEAVLRSERRGGPSGPGGPHVPAGGPLGPDGPGQVAGAAGPRGAGALPAGHGAAAGAPGVSKVAPVPAFGVAAAGRRAAPPDHGKDGALDRRGAPGHGAPQGGRLRPVLAARGRPGPPVPGPPGLRGELPPDRHPDGGRRTVRPRRLRGLGEPAGGAPFGPARGAGGGRGAAARSAPCHRGAGRHRGGAGHGAGGPPGGAGARVCGPIAPAAGGFSGAAPRGGAP